MTRVTFSRARCSRRSLRTLPVRTVALRSGVRLRVAESGPSDGRPVVMLHGWGASLYMFRHAFERFLVPGIRAIAVDLRGYGLSDKPLADDSYSLKAFSADVDELLDELRLSEDHARRPINGRRSRPALRAGAARARVQRSR